MHINAALFGIVYEHIYQWLTPHYLLAVVFIVTNVNVCFIVGRNKSAVAPETPYIVRQIICFYDFGKYVERETVLPVMTELAALSFFIQINLVPCFGKSCGGSEPAVTCANCDYFQLGSTP